MNPSTYIGTGFELDGYHTVQFVLSDKDGITAFHTDRGRIEYRKDIEIQLINNKLKSYEYVDWGLAPEGYREAYEKVLKDRLKELEHGENGERPTGDEDEVSV